MKKTYLAISIITVVTIFLSQACSKLGPAAPADNETLDGTVDGLSYDALRQHAAGDEAFTDEIFTAETGLGPVFSATSCGTCHAGDGKGAPFTTLTRFGKTDTLTDENNTPHGPQLQNHAIAGFQPETLPAGQPHAGFTPPINTGLGFLELVSDEDILAMAAANTSNPDGVRGHPNWNHIPAFVTPNPDDINQNGRYICRFGKKASAYNLLHQTVFAYNQDIGIATSFLPVDSYSGNTIDPEITDNTVRDVMFYLQTLKAPVQRNPNDAEVVKGKQVFIAAGCESCHKQTLQTGYSPVESLSYKEFHPYTDLLLHDMGPGLDDGYTEGTAKTSEWRTAPLWGLGLAPNSQGGKYYLLHDGRAHSIEEAISKHGGEATSAKNRVDNLSLSDRAALIAFLKSL